ncbi:ankyrin repeat domain-containing protein [Yinghuangia sp. YIM S09857]|uniref:ankyrin repeat domain-containing protein n=1 Tax=Yinghuangia sp. YIM S09857 TaxID=3436929 RepID=UPI003F53022A
MGFFDGLITPDPPEPEPTPPQEIRLPRYVPPNGIEEHPPTHMFVPAWAEQIVEVGRGDDVRIVLNGWEVWRHSATLRLGVFRSRITTGGPQRPHPMGRPPAGGLRCGLLLGDGRRVTTLDGQPWPAPPPGSAPRPTLTLRPGMGGGHHFDVALHLSQLPPDGPLRLIIEWPDAGVVETATELDAALVRAASQRAHEAWPDLDPPPPPSADDGSALRYTTISTSTGAADIMAAPRPPMPPQSMPAQPMRPQPMRHVPRPHPGPMPAQAMPPRPMPQPRPHPWPPAPAGTGTRTPPRSPAAHASAVNTPPPPPPSHERGDWEEMGRNGLADLELVRARLALGADPNQQRGEDGGNVLHVATEFGSPDVVAELAAHVDDIDAVAPWSGESALWKAVCLGKTDNAAALLAAGADPWRPVMGRHSAGSIARWTKLAPLFAQLPGYVAPTDAERAAQDAADRQAVVIAEEEYFMLSVTFVAGLDEDEVIHRLGGDPSDCPVLDLDATPGPFGTGPDGFNPHDPDVAERFVGIRAVPGGCAVLQPNGLIAATSTVVTALSRGTRAYGIYLSFVKGTYGELAVDGTSVCNEELQRNLRGESLDSQALYRFWDNDPEGAVDSHIMWTAYKLAYAAAEAGVSVTDASQIAGPPNRWLELPPDSPLLRRPAQA